MTEKHTNSNSVNDSSRCQHHFINGTRCRLLVPSAESLFCRNHAQLSEHEHASVDLSSSLTVGLTEFTSAIPLNKFLSRLLHLQVEGRIHPRRAVVMAYTCNLILRTLPAIEHELHPEDEPVTIDFGTLPRPPGCQGFQCPPGQVVQTCLGAPRTPTSPIPRSPHEHNSREEISK